MSNKDINIIFFGNTDFSNPTLLACNYSFNLKAVVTNKSKKMGRGQKILDTPVMTLAKEENLKIIEGVDLNDTSFIDQLKDLNPDFRSYTKSFYTISKEPHIVITIDIFNSTFEINTTISHINNTPMCI